MKFFEELKRRNVIRMAAVYVAVGWLLTQVAATLETAIGLPAWFDGMVVALLAIGFPLAMIFSWAFEITPEGVKRTAEVDAAASVAPNTGRKLDYILLAAAAIAVAVVAADRLAPAKPAGAAQTAEAAALSADDKSIAVLPFVDLSPEGDQEYFADGLSEELLNVLAQSRDLRVAGRTSSFAYKGRNVDLREIGDALGVAHILEGSVRKSGDRIRVTAQLIKASDGYHVFSNTYDRDLADIFAVQDDIAGKIGAALKAQLSGGSASDTAPAALEAYDLYLLARQRIYTREVEPMREAGEMLDRALAIDPDYAPALAQKAILVMLMSVGSSTYGETPISVAGPQAAALIDRALAVAPDLAEAYAARGLMNLYIGAPLEQVEGPLKRAIELNPSLSDAQNWLANTLTRRGDYDRALGIYEALFERDPLYFPAFNNLVNAYSATRQYERTEKVIARVERIAGADSQYVLLARGVLAWEQGDLAEAARCLERAYEFGAYSNVLRSAYAYTMAQLGEMEKALKAAWPGDEPLFLHLAGRRAEAASAAEALYSAAEPQVDALAAVFFEFAVTDRHAEAVELVESRFGSPEALAEAYPISISTWGAILAVSYKALGRKKEVAGIARLMEDAAALDRESGGDGFNYWYPLAEIAAVLGERDLAIERLQIVLDREYADVFGFYSPAFDGLRNDERFQALETQVRDRANAERVKLGLKPL